MKSVKVTYIEDDGSKHEVEVESGTTLMQAALDNMVDGIVGDCGGGLSCATCHCYIDEAWLDVVGVAEDTEKDMLICAIDPKENSRLSCQVTVTDEMDGLVVSLPEAQF